MIPSFFSSSSIQTQVVTWLQLFPVDFFLFLVVIAAA